MARDKLANVNIIITISIIEAVIVANVARIQEINSLFIIIIIIINIFITESQHCN